MVLCVSATGCTTATESRDDERKQVVTTFTVLADMARNVAGDRIDVHSITKPGAEVHGYDPTPSDMLDAAKADLVLDNGLGLESWFGRFVERSEARHVTVSEGITPIPIAAGDRQGSTDPSSSTDPPGGANPHAWMSPREAAVYVDNIRDAFIRLDPGGEPVYRSNAEHYRQQLDQVDRYLHRELDTVPDRHRALVTCEGAFSYLARDAGLDEAYLWPVNSGEEGTPQQITDTTRFVRESGVPAVFCESTVSDKAQRQVAAETGARLGPELYVDSLSGPEGPVPTYLDLLRHDARSIVAALRGEHR
nr:metal ABC transporter substrate-binding protein [Saccharopolyspora sp. HNM0983]